MGWFSRRRKTDPDEELTAPVTPADAEGDSDPGASEPDTAEPDVYEPGTAKPVAELDIGEVGPEFEAGRPWTGRALLLPATPTPANASELARIATEAAQTVAGIDLDFSPASLQVVDGILDGFREAGSDIMAESIFIFGCYIGEVLVRNAGYEWVNTPADLAKHLGVLTVYHPETQAHANPINKAFKRVDYGEPDNLPYFYQVFAGDGPFG
ncbi:hypothetical protein [Mycobacterium intermedium]|uniref:hypothetical protein n=1 Tax=Mycobacterium intermedium TaxID=28445 RepID=UPI001E5D5938|nr:hypothetical protein [Mycobacterium intermedium]